MSASFGYQSYLYFFDLLCSLFILLPCYYAIPGMKGRRALLTAAGVYLLYFVAPRLAFFYLVFWTVTFFIHRHAFADGKARSGAEKSLAVVALACLPVIVLPLVFWKVMGESFVYPFSFYTDAALPWLSNRLWQIDICAPLVLPLGLSFSTFRAVDLIIKTALGKVTGLSLNDVLFYGLFPPVQMVGPIIEYEEIEKGDARPDPESILEGLLCIAAGFFKVFALATLLEDNTRIFAAPAAFSAPVLWLRLVGYSWYFYLNFAGYSDMAIGTARLFGFRLKDNFNFPFFSRNIAEFWNSWHMSLSRWAQRNVFVPCGGYRLKTQYTALFLTMLAIAMWHDISLSMLVFALVQFTALALHRRRAGKPAPAVARLGRAGGIAITYLTILLCFPLLVLGLAKALGFYAALFGAGS